MKEYAQCDSLKLKPKESSAIDRQWSGKLTLGKSKWVATERGPGVASGVLAWVAGP